MVNFIVVAIALHELGYAAMVSPLSCYTCPRLSLCFVLFCQSFRCTRPRAPSCSVVRVRARCVHDSRAVSPQGIRLDSGDLAYLSRESRKAMLAAAAAHGCAPLAAAKIVASNDLDETVRALLGAAHAPFCPRILCAQTKKHTHTADAASS